MKECLYNVLLLLGVVTVFLFVLLMVGIAINEMVVFFTIHKRK